MTTALVQGSLKAIAADANVTLAEAFTHADAIVLVDVSGSMATNDARGGNSRYDVACEELRKLQTRLPGKLAVVGFSGTVAFAPSGVPTFSGGSTDLAAALRFVKVADGTVKFVVVSDGYPNDPEAALREARRFTSVIDVVYVGAPDGSGEAFLAQLARAAKGRYVAADRANELAEAVQKMLAAPVTSD